ncbi:MAG: SDR family NAD(P)-dependent oxidoreductase [Chlamydiota bacterium]
MLKVRDNVKKYALVTGASQGIGYALVKKLIFEGVRVVGISRSKEKLEKMKKEFGADFFLCCKKGK